MHVQNMPVIWYLIHGTSLSFPVDFALFGLCIEFCCNLYFLYNYVCKLVLVSMKILENDYQR